MTVTVVLALSALLAVAGCSSVGLGRVGAVAVEPSATAVAVEPSATAVAVDVSDLAGCRAGDLPGYDRPRWITTSAGFLNADGSAWIQCGVSRWPDEASASADFATRRAVLDATAEWLADRQPPGESLRAIDSAPVVGERVAFEERRSAGPSRHTWLVVFRDRRYVAVAAIHSTTSSPVASASAFEQLVLIVAERVRSLS